MSGVLPARPYAIKACTEPVSILSTPVFKDVTLPRWVTFPKTEMLEYATVNTSKLAQFRYTYIYIASSRLPPLDTCWIRSDGK